MTKKESTWFSDFIAWLKPSLSGYDGNSSHKRLTVLNFIFVVNYMVYKTGHGVEYPDIAWMVVAGGAGIFSALTTYQNIKSESQHPPKPPKS